MATTTTWRWATKTVSHGDLVAYIIAYEMFGGFCFQQCCQRKVETGLPLYITLYLDCLLTGYAMCAYPYSYIGIFPSKVLPFVGKMQSFDTVHHCECKYATPIDLMFGIQAGPQ